MLMIYSRGIITKSTSRVPFRTITNIEVKRGPLDRNYGFTTIEIVIITQAVHASSVKTQAVSVEEQTFMLM